MHVNVHECVCTVHGSSRSIKLHGQSVKTRRLGRVAVLWGLIEASPSSSTLGVSSAAVASPLVGSVTLLDGQALGAFGAPQRQLRKTSNLAEKASAKLSTGTNQIPIFTTNSSVAWHVIAM